MQPIVGRIERLLFLLFSGIQQRDASRQLSVSQTLISTSLTGFRNPSKTLIEKLSAYPGVNPRWLLDGIGEPLQEGFETTLPVILKISQKLGTPWEELTSESDRYRISENQYSETRYWYRVTKRALKEWGEWAEKKIRLQPDDYLLLETAPKQIESLPGQNRVAVVSVPEFQCGKPGWGVLTSRREFVPFANLESEETKANVKRTPQKRPVRKITFPNKEPKQSTRSATVETASSGFLKSNRTEKPMSFSVQSGRVMAVVLEMTSDTLLQKVSD